MIYIKYFHSSKFKTNKKGTFRGVQLLSLLPPLFLPFILFFYCLSFTYVLFFPNWSPAPTPSHSHPGQVRTAPVSTSIASFLYTNVLDVFTNYLIRNVNQAWNNASLLPFFLKSLFHCPHLFKGLNHLLSLNPTSPLLSHGWEIWTWRNHMAKSRCDRNIWRASEQNSVKVFKSVC